VLTLPAVLFEREFPRLGDEETRERLLQRHVRITDRSGLAGFLDLLAQHVLGRP